MLTTMEIGLVDLIKNSALKSVLKAIGTLPDEDEDALVARFAADSPAVYVVAGKPLSAGNGELRVSFGFACVARNARSHEEARRGDGKAIGLYQILWSVLGLVENAQAGGHSWRVTHAGYLNSDKVWKAGLTVAVVTVETTTTMPQGIDESTLSDFVTFHADYDIPPHETADEHTKWTGEPPDYSQAKPELQDTLTLPQI